MSFFDNRLSHIDGIRGIASMLVIFCHLSCVFYMPYYMNTPESNAFSQLFLASPLNVLTNGHTAVQCFFLLSGFLIARKLHLKREDAVQSPISQYLKLLKVVIPAVTFTALLMACGMMCHQKAFAIAPQLSFVTKFNYFTPTLRSILADIFYWTFIQGSQYVTPLWTIHLELFGSILVYAFVFYAFSKSSLTNLIFLGFCVVIRFTCDSKLIAFVLGAWTFHCVQTFVCHKKEMNDELGGIRLVSNRLIRMLLLGFGLYLACSNRKLTGCYAPLDCLLVHKVLGGTNVLVSIGLSLCLFCIETSTMLKRVLSIPPLRFLGSISAYTYAFHWPIILSLGCYVFLLLHGIMPYKWNVLCVSIVVFASTFFLAWIYTILLAKITFRCRSYIKANWKTNA